MVVIPFFVSDGSPAMGKRAPWSGVGCGFDYSLLCGGLDQRTELRAELVLIEEYVAPNADTSNLTAVDAASDCRLGERRALRGRGDGEELGRVNGQSGSPP